MCLQLHQRPLQLRLNPDETQRHKEDDSASRQPGFLFNAEDAEVFAKTRRGIPLRSSAPTSAPSAFKKDVGNIFSAFFAPLRFILRPRMIYATDQLFVSLKHTIVGWLPAFAQPIASILISVSAILLTFSLLFAITTLLDS